MISSEKILSILKGFLITLVPLIYIGIVKVLIEGQVQQSGIIEIWLFCLGVYGITWLLFSQALRNNFRMILLIIIAESLTLIAYSITGHTILAWLGLVIYFVLLIIFADYVIQLKGVINKILLIGLIAFWAGAVPVSAAQIESHFSDEEFFVFFQAVFIGVLWLIIFWTLRVWNKNIFDNNKPPARYRTGLITMLIILTSIGGFIMIRQYQRSFYPSQAPGYAGITPEKPFICGRQVSENTQYSGKAIFENILALIESNPNKDSPEYAALAIGTRSDTWAQFYREAILDEASRMLYTNPANSVKSVQYQMSRRVYFYVRMREIFPELLTPEEDALVKDWFKAINKRSLSVEWVDWLYAISFAKLPQGPYENQEIGAGLLALLEKYDLADPNLSNKNQKYLEENPRGWLARFRNTDDAIVYQPHWIYNSFFQSLYTGQVDQENLKLSIEWLILQALPDGTPPKYNHIGPASIAELSYWGTGLVGNPQYMWIAGRSVDFLRYNGEYLSAMPGDENLIDVPGSSPDFGSCLIFGDSGLPNQVGPLAPDKIVFRDGWSTGSAYMLLNLRFSGWHRYKATNTIINLYQNGQILNEDLNNDPSYWLPEGRSLFRDKRVPRQNLNGMLIQNRGLSLVLYRLSSIGSPWAQDPPYYADVIEFSNSDTLDMSKTSIKDWHGWDQLRTVYFYHSGLIVILDVANGPSSENASVVWQTQEFELLADSRYMIRSGEHPAEMVLLPLDGEGTLEIEDQLLSDRHRVYVHSKEEKGIYALATVILTGKWIGSQVDLTNGNPNNLLITKDGQSLTVPLE